MILKKAAYILGKYIFLQLLNLKINTQINIEYNHEISPNEILAFETNNLAPLTHPYKLDGHSHSPHQT